MSILKKDNDILKNSSGILRYNGGVSGVYAFNNSLLGYNGYIIGDVSAGAAPTPSYPTDSLIARWDFDSQNGEDSYGSFDLVSTNLGYTASGKISYGADFVNGAYGGYNSSINSYQVNRSIWSVSLWLKIPSGNTEYVKAISDSGAQSGKTEIVVNYGVFTGINNNSIGIYRGTNYNTVNVFSTATYADGNWHHVVGGYDGDKLFLYIDNSSVGEYSTTANYNSGSNFWVGANGGITQANHYEDQVYFYNKVLSAAEVSQLYNGGSGV